MIRLLSLITLSIASAFCLYGCGLFDTRAPENPVSSGSAFENPTSPTIVLRNMENALNYANANDYRRCFSDTSDGLPSFIFQPSIQGFSAAPTKFANWGIREEEQYIRSIFNELQDGGVCSVLFTPEQITDAPIGDSVQFSANYKVHFPHTRAGAETDAEGRLQFTLRASPQNVWYISYWRDDATVNDKPTWSLIKARFADN